MRRQDELVPQPRANIASDAPCVDRLGGVACRQLRAHSAQIRLSLRHKRAAMASMINGAERVGTGAPRNANPQAQRHRSRSLARRCPPPNQRPPHVQASRATVLELAETSRHRAGSGRLTQVTLRPWPDAYSSKPCCDAWNALAADMPPGSRPSPAIRGSRKSLHKPDGIITK